MKLLFLISVFVATLLSACSEKCSDTKFRKLMGNLYQKQILFPAEVELLNKKGTDSTYWSKINTQGAEYYILHFFMSDCDKCVNELKNIQKFMDKHPSSANFKYLFITSGPTKKYAQEAIELSGFTQPVYYEKNYFSFKKLNELPLADKLYNTLLLRNDKVILFGEAFHNEKAEDLFFNAINYCHNL